MRETKITLHYEILKHLKKHKGTSCPTIATKLNLRPYEVYYALKDLERQGLAKRWFPPLWGATFRDEEEADDVEVD